jgi:hypothetical protein
MSGRGVVKIRHVKEGGSVRVRRSRILNGRRRVLVVLACKLWQIGQRGHRGELRRVKRSENGLARRRGRGSVIGKFEGANRRTIADSKLEIESFGLLEGGSFGSDSGNGRALGTG